MQVFPHLEHTYIALACNRGNHKFYSLDSCYFAQLPPNRFVDHRIQRHLTMITRTLGQYVAVQSSQRNLPVHRSSCNENFPNRKKPGRPARIQCHKIAHWNQPWGRDFRKREVRWHPSPVHSSTSLHTPLWHNACQTSHGIKAVKIKFACLKKDGTCGSGLNLYFRWRCCPWSQDCRSRRWKRWQKTTKNRLYNDSEGKQGNWH